MASTATGNEAIDDGAAPAGVLGATTLS